MNENEDLEHLVQRARLREEGACRILFERYRRRVLMVCLSFRPIGEADAQDLTQEVFSRAFRSLGGLAETGRFEAWLLTIARKRCLSFCRGRRNAEVAWDDHQTEALSEDTRSGLDADERGIISEEIERLSEEPFGRAGRMFYLEDANSTEIAERLGVPVSTVTTWLCRFRGRIRKRLLVRLAEARGEARER